MKIGSKTIQKLMNQKSVPGAHGGGLGGAWGQLGAQRQNKLGKCGSLDPLGLQKIIPKSNRNRSKITYLFRSSC